MGELSPGDRQKIMTVCTIDVHARDVVAKLISQKASVSLEGDLPLFPGSGIYCQGRSEVIWVP